MLADGLTKALLGNKWQTFLDHLNLVERTDDGNHQEIALNELQEKLKQFTV
jgi:hypothetical protein